MGNVEIKKEDLRLGLCLVSSAVPTLAATNEALCVKIETVAEGVCLSAADGSVYASSIVPVTEAVGDVQALVPARKLSSIVYGWIDAYVTLQGTRNGFEIKGDSGRFQLKTYDFDLFPEIPGCESKGSFQIKGAELARAANSVQHAVSKLPGLVIGGVLFNIEGDTLTVVGCGRNRGSFFRCNIDNDRNASFVLPAKTSVLLHNFFNNCNDTVQVTYDDDKVCFASSEYTIFSGFMEGNYPNYRQIEELKTKGLVTVERQTLLKIIKMAALANDKDSCTVLLKLGMNKLSVSANAESIGASELGMQVDHGGNLQVHLNAGYLENALKYMDSDFVRLEYIAPDSPVLFRNEDKQLSFVMPVIDKTAA